MPHRFPQLVRCLLLFGCLAAGCNNSTPPPVDAPFSSVLGCAFVPSTAGTIRGRVTWEGSVPDVSPFTYRANPAAGSGFAERQVRANPNAPRVGASGGVEDVVVFLRGVEPWRSRPWDLPPVRVEAVDRQYTIRQGEDSSRVGFLRQGDMVEVVSCEGVYHAVRGSGAAFFALALPDPDRPRLRLLGNSGVVELTSGAGYAWMRAYLFVDEHPYYVRTDAEGYFVLPHVPSACYEVVCWAPNWNLARGERHPESGQWERLTFRQPVEQGRTVNLVPGGVAEVSFTLSARQFE